MSLKLDDILILWYELICPFTKLKTMKLRKHDQSINGGKLSPLMVVKLYDTLDKELNIIISALKDPTYYPEYCLMVGDYDSKAKIVDSIKDLYHIQWIGDHYCIATYKSPRTYYIPKASVKVSDLCFILELRENRVLCTPHPDILQAYNDVERDITLILEPWFDVIADPELEVKVDYENRDICVIYTPFHQLELLKYCLGNSE